MDYENFLCTLLLPKATRNSALAIRAFNVELAQIQDMVTEKHIGKMRIQFWKDTMEKIYKGHPPQHPVALAVIEAVQKHNLSKMWFTRLTDARESNLEDRPHTSVKNLEVYCENSVSSVLYLVLEAAGIKDVHADHAASHIGKAVGIVTLLRAAPYLANRRKVYIPNDILIKHNVSHQDIIKGSTAQPVKDVTFELASLANNHLSTAQSFKTKIPKAAFRVFLPSVSCQHYLNKIQRVDFDLFHSSLRERNHLLPIQLLRNAWTRRY
ncbi:NADH dehydrogenase (ubiquinone) complex I, assembly factor 6-like isoform X2 [Actinia tenebrosa]|nr:NADH dehydrogenase (ubiquinone) complex I, assembly factor 6-like isoform X2 [Actinia tenebrosa]